MDHAEHHQPACRLVRAGAEFTGKQELAYQPGISAEAVGAKGIHLQIVTLAPGARAKAHRHESHETAIYILSGVSQMWWGDRLEHHAVCAAGDFVYIPANVPHLPYNSGSEPCVAIISRTDPNEQESVVLMPELDTIHPSAAPPSSAALPPEAGEKKSPRVEHRLPRAMGTRQNPRALDQHQ